MVLNVVSFSRTKVTIPDLLYGSCVLVSYSLGPLGCCCFAYAGSVNCGRDRADDAKRRAEKSALAYMFGVSSSRGILGVVSLRQPGFRHAIAEDVSILRWTGLRGLFCCQYAAVLLVSHGQIDMRFDGNDMAGTSTRCRGGLMKCKYVWRGMENAPSR